MMLTLATAIIAVFGAISGAYLTNFVAEDFRRHRDGMVIAAALAGELEAHSLSIPMLRAMLQGLVETINEGGTLTLARFDKPDDPIYNASIAKLGLLGVEVNREISFTYQNIRAFRNSFAYVCNSETELPKDVLESALKACISFVDRAEKSGLPLLVKLTEIAAKNYKFSVHRIKIEIE